MSKTTTTTTQEFEVKEVKEILAKHLGKSDVQVDYVISTVEEDWLSPGRKEVTSVRVTYAGAVDQDRQELLKPILNRLAGMDNQQLQEVSKYLLVNRG